MYIFALSFTGLFSNHIFFKHFFAKLILFCLCKWYKNEAVEL